MKKVFLGLFSVILFSLFSFTKATTKNDTEKSVRVLCHVTVWSHVGNTHYEDHFYFYTDSASSCFAKASAMLK